MAEVKKPETDKKKIHWGCREDVGKYYTPYGHVWKHSLSVCGDVSKKWNMNPLGCDIPMQPKIEGFEGSCKLSRALKKSF